MNKQPIGVFDSGVGGLSILRELHRLLPGEDYIFLADQTHVPYGEKSQTQLIRLACRIADFFVSRNAKLMVVACNTSTCYAIDALREKYSFPIVG
ncbi:MAG TPA: glutamate racemase, partial [Candidatus Paceibacterota bacterium]|nr:glutamate racemase [Candidatus Paceibacterota bacterium]